MKSLKNKVILITGASDGLGKQLAYDLVGEEAILTLISKSKDKLDAVVRNVKKQGGICQGYVCNVGDEAQVAESVRNIIKSFRTIDVLINNAGIYNEDQRLVEKPGSIEEMFWTNTLGVMHCTNAVLPLMKQRNAGQILNVVSVAGLEPSAKWGIYSATKHAERGFTESLKLKLQGTSIKVMGIYPEAIDTNIYKSAGLTFGHNEPWMMKVEDVSRIIVFMLSQPPDINLSQIVVRKIE